ncbi:hypothetical protein DNTS_030394 [Danionella cerebrum]|uniref:Uncharacterized protein n=1 Tax=Danionella cerebrum TaxID=2873325 RepID=A0A553QWH6_9TELE|nr:hypothetical protein DNTS_030394 [Danionella translucida]
MWVQEFVHTQIPEKDFLTQWEDFLSLLASAIQYLDEGRQRRLQIREMEAKSTLIALLENDCYIDSSAPHGFKS